MPDEPWLDVRLPRGVWSTYLRYAQLEPEAVGPVAAPVLEAIDARLQREAVMDPTTFSATASGFAGGRLSGRPEPLDVAVLCECGHERDIWHLTDDAGIGVGACSGSVVGAACACAFYRARPAPDEEVAVDPDPTTVMHLPGAEDVTDAWRPTVAHPAKAMSVEEGLERMAVADDHEPTTVISVLCASCHHHRLDHATDDGACRMMTTIPGRAGSASECPCGRFRGDDPVGKALTPEEHRKRRGDPEAVDNALRDAEAEGEARRTAEAASRARLRADLIEAVDHLRVVLGEWLDTFEEDR